MDVKLENQIKKFVPEKYQPKITTLINEMGFGGLLVVEVTKNAIRFYDRNMNGCSLPLNFFYDKEDEDATG